MGFLVLLSLAIPGLVLLLRRADFPNVSLLGLAAGGAPLLASTAWSVYFILHYGNGYDFDGMQLMNLYKLQHYALTPILTPLYANLIWRKSDKPSLMRERIALIAGFIGACILAENTPVGWSFTFVLFPVSLFVLLIGFLFPKRKTVSP